jgi:hypothetical protein
MLTPIEQELAAHQRAVESAKNQIAMLKASRAELVDVLTGCADALHESALMLSHLNCPGHAAVADIHSQAARAAIAKVKGE